VGAGAEYGLSASAEVNYTAVATGAKFMAGRGKATLVQSALVLALMGIVAGVVGGLVVGAATAPKPATSSTAH
jgi:hypothetical protein